MAENVRATLRLPEMLAEAMLHQRRRMSKHVEAAHAGDCWTPAAAAAALKRKLLVANRTGLAFPRCLHMLAKVVPGRTHQS